MRFHIYRGPRDRHEKEINMPAAQTTVDLSEVAKFEAMAAEWWDPTGKFKPLHMMNPVRLDYITRRIAERFGRDLNGPTPFEGLRILDIGCGGGLLSEPMARLGAAGVVAGMPLMPIYAVGLEWYFFDRTAHSMALPAIAVMASGIVLAAGAGQANSPRQNSE